MEIDSGQPNTKWAQCKDQIEIVFKKKKKRKSKEDVKC